MSMPIRRTLVALSWIPVVITFNTNVMSLTWVEGGSMKPVLNPDTNLGWRDLLVVKRYGVKQPQGITVGDVVVFISPENPSKILVKRVLGTEGDTVEPRASSMYPKKTCHIPRGHLWVEGDNIHSIDSNKFGPISSGLVVGKATCVLFPFYRFGSICNGGREAILE